MALAGLVEIAGIRWTVEEDFAHGLEQAVLPREAFLAEVEPVSVERAAGRTAAEMISSYPPGVPVAGPGEVIANEVLDHLRTGVNHGVLIPDVADPSVGTLRGVARHRGPARRGRPVTACSIFSPGATTTPRPAFHAFGLLFR